MVCPILISVSLAPGSYRRSAANKEDVTRTVAQAISAFTERVRELSVMAAPFFQSDVSDGVSDAVSQKTSQQLERGGDAQSNEAFPLCAGKSSRSTERVLSA